jgi:hypothetical protein
MIEEIHEYAIPLDEDESNHPELDPPGEFIDPNDPRLAEPILELNPERDSYAPSMLKETVSSSGEVEISLVNFW